MWPFANDITGQPVHINCGEKSPEFRKKRAETRISNLTSKVVRLYTRAHTKEIEQELANTQLAITKWNNIQIR